MHTVFRWNECNVWHIGKHGISIDEAEYVVNHARRPWPEKIGDAKWRIWGQTDAGSFVQFIFVFSPDDVVYVIHAMRLSARQIRQFHRRSR